MHSLEIHAEVRRLAAAGLIDREVAERVGLARSTVRDIRRAASRADDRVRCPRCWKPMRPLAFDDEIYAYLLGMYLGDGCISRNARTHSLRISLDVKHQAVIDEVHAALLTLMPNNKVSQHRAGERRTTHVLCVYGKHLPCLFPQHGPGKKQDRSIVLEPWQDAIVAANPWPLLRGLIHSDGCRFINRTGPYEYTSYQFMQVSDDIRRIFTSACDQAGVDYRVNGRTVWMRTRKSVALLDLHVGPKS